MSEHHYEGSPADMRAWLTTLGWDEIAGIHSEPAQPDVLAFGPFAIRRILGQDVAFVLLVLANEIDVPEGIVESEAGSIAVGVMMAGPRKPTPLEWMDRLPQERQVAIHAAAQTNPTLAYALFRLGAAQEVDVTDPMTLALVQAVRDADVISLEEYATLLTQ